MRFENDDLIRRAQQLKDESFHREWALQLPVDRLKWEVLNRLHRLLNDAVRASS